jgi:hypothetical protein
VIGCLNREQEAFRTCSALHVEIRDSHHLCDGVICKPWIVHTNRNHLRERG